MESKLICLVLIILGTVIILINYYWLKPNLEQVNAHKAAIISRRFAEAGELNSSEIIDILLSFAKVSSDGLWIHSIKVEQNNIDLKIRAFDPRTIEKYVYAVVDKTHLKLENMVTKNVKYKEEAADEQNTNTSQQKQIPLAVKLFLAREANNTRDEQSDDDNKDDYTKDKILFSYEAEVKLLAHSH